MPRKGVKIPSQKNVKRIDFEDCKNIDRFQYDPSSLPKGDVRKNYSQYLKVRGCVAKIGRVKRDGNKYDKVPVEIRDAIVYCDVMTRQKSKYPNAFYDNYDVYSLGYKENTEKDCVVSLTAVIPDESKDRRVLYHSKTVTATKPKK